jgi:hypothetical protein
MAEDDLSDDEILKADFFALSTEQQKRHHRLRAERFPLPGALKYLSGDQGKQLTEAVLRDFPEVETELRIAETNWSHDRDNKRRKKHYDKILQIFRAACDRLGYPSSHYETSPTLVSIIFKVRADLEATGLSLYPMDSPSKKTR